MSAASYPPNDKTFEGLIGDMSTRIDELSRRQIPPRLGSAGQEVTDWNDALDDGFYWSLPTAANAPNLINTTNSVMGWVVNTFTDAGLRGTRQFAIRSTQDVIETRYRNTLGVWGPWVAQYNVIDGGVIAHSATPDSFKVGVTVGTADASYPGGQFGTVEVIHQQAGRTIQRVTYKGDNTIPTQTWQRAASGAGATWGAWGMSGGDIPWTNLSAYITGSGVTGTIEGTRTGRVVEVAGNLSGLSLANGSNVDFMSGIPTEFRPATSRNRFGTGWSGNWSLPVFFRQAGTAAVGNRTGAVLASFQFSIVYTI